MSTNTPQEPELSVSDVIRDQSRRVLETYKVDPGLIQEHANGERRITQGGYGERQIYELVQNGADELRDHEGSDIHVVLTKTHLYCANEGAPVTPAGADTILRMSVSRKRGGQIGRFGVGVKSVLSISNTPQFFSTTGCFGFDKDWATEKIREQHPDVKEVPVLRMAQLIDREKAIAEDPILNDLLSWATTVVRLPLIPSAVDRLGDDLANFPAEFPLFSPHVKTVILEDRRVVPPRIRQIFQHSEGNLHRVQEVRANEDEITSEWRVFTRTVRPSATALAAAGELHDRPEIDISWAVPAGTKRIRELGRFWAYFPTNYKTLLRGILNAPWKTSEDRQNLFDKNAFNRELIMEAALLVIDSLPELSDAEDPSAFIDLLPGRGREAPQWADRELTEAIWTSAGRGRTLPDQNGVLQYPSQIKMHPDGLDPSWLKLWRSYPNRPVDWCHHSMETRERRPRAERILASVERPVASVRDWLEALVADESPEASAIAIRIAASMKRARHTLAEEAGRARIVLTEDLGLVAPGRGNIFRRASTDELADNLVYVDDRVLAEPDVIAALDELGIHEANPVGRFEAVVDKGFLGYTDTDWAGLWTLARQAGVAEAAQVLLDGVAEPTSKLKVRTLSGEFAFMKDCLLPGKVVPADGSRDARIAVDIGYHAAELEVLRRMGMHDAPRSSVDPRGEHWYAEYVESRWQRHCSRLPNDAARPTLKSARVEGADPVGPLGFLPRLSPEGRAAFLEALPQFGLVKNWTLQFGGKTSERQQVISPFVWMARKYGYLRTSRGLKPVVECVSPAMREHSDVLPVAEVPQNIAEVLGLPATLSVLRTRASFWRRLVAEAAASTDDLFAGRVYALLFEADAEWPEGQGTRCRVPGGWSTEIPDEEIAVTADRDDYAALVREGFPALLMPTPESAAQAMEIWGMMAPGDLIKKEVVYVAESEPVLLLEEFRHLRTRYRQRLEGWSLVRCKALDEVVRTPNGMTTTPLKEVDQGQNVLVLNPKDDFEALMAVDRVLRLGLGAAGCRSILDSRERERQNALMREARVAKSTEEKVLKLIGEENLRRGLPAGLIEREKAKSGKAPDAKRIAKLAINSHGSGLLRHHSKDLAERVPTAPTRFGGTAAARQFVSELGLDESYAGAAIQSPDQVETVDGPTAFPRLHDYQERLATKMYRVLTERVNARAMLDLPTGAGKTRVAAEAVIRVIKEPGLRGPVLWIAQSEELCEQAVQSWKFVWSKVGAPTPLTISRLWSTNHATPVKNGPHLVVATDAKLEKCLGEEDYAWLRDAGIVIVDEAHASYDRMTPILKLLGITAFKTERPLIGLTATPYRGFNEDETRLLVQRYGRNRLADGVFDGDPYQALQELGVLAKVDHKELRGSTIKLTDQELKAADVFGLPASVEHRLALDEERNDMLLREIEQMPRDWPVLMFASSVNHAKLMAAVLTGEGIPAAAIDSYMPISERRARIDDFRTGKLRVLTNYGVLAQGFDAPATRAVIIARPTYSPNTYTQMIGRGLRGPKNNGKEYVQILDVHDNIVNYDRKLAFTEFDHLWSAK